MRDNETPDFSKFMDHLFASEQNVTEENLLEAHAQYIRLCADILLKYQEQGLNQGTQEAMALALSNVASMQREIAKEIRRLKTKIERDLEVIKAIKGVE